MNNSLALERARTFLFVPANRLDRCAKAMAGTADIVIVDLEDSVAEPDKARARSELASAWSHFACPDRMAIRINSLESAEHLDDVFFCQSIKPCAVVVPKADDVDKLRALAVRLGLPLLPIIESALGLARVDGLAAVPGVARLIFGNLDFALDLGMEPGDDEPELAAARLAIVVATRLAGIAAAVDGVTTNLQRPEQLIRDVIRARRFGFGAKLCVHPSQLEIVKIGLSPSIEQIAEARAVVAASVEAGGGAIRLDGKMIDIPVLRKAERILRAVTDQSIETDAD